MNPTLLIYGINHQSAPVATRERLAYADGEMMRALVQLKEQAPSLVEVALLSTCNRIEIIGTGTNDGRALEEIVSFFASDRAVTPETFKSALYKFEGRAAARHLFRVSASLESMIVGEAQILGQTKVAYAQAAKAGTTGLVLHRAFHKAFSVAKRERKETLIGHGAVSASSSAVSLVGRIFDRFDDKTAMLIGAGRTGELTARNLKRRGIGTLLITNPTFERAVALAHELGGTPIPYANFRPHLQAADVIIGSLTTTQPILGPDEFASVLAKPRLRSTLLIDLGVPRNFDERLDTLESIYLYDIDDLGKVAVKSLEERQREVVKAEQIIEFEVNSFMRWLAELDLVPAIKDIRYSVEQLRADELERHRAWLAGLAPDERERIEFLSRSLTNKLLHRVLSDLRDSYDGTGEGAHAAAIARRLLCAELPI